MPHLDGAYRQLSNRLTRWLTTRFRALRTRFAGWRTLASRGLAKLGSAAAALAIAATLGIVSPLAANAVDSANPAQSGTPPPTTVANGAISGEAAGEAAGNAAGEAAGEEAGEVPGFAEASQGAGESDANASAANESAPATPGPQLRSAAGSRGAAGNVDFSEIPEQWQAKGTNIFQQDGGYYNPLGYILSNYNVFVQGDATNNSHVIGSVFVGGDFHTAVNVFGNGHFTHRVSSYVGGLWRNKDAGLYPGSNTTNNPNDVRLYLGKVNYDPAIQEGRFKPRFADGNAGILFTNDNQYAGDLNAMFADIAAQTESLSNPQSGAITVTDVQSGEHITFGNDGNLYLDAGFTYLFTAELLAKYPHAGRKIILRVTKPIDDVSQMPETIIVSNDSRIAMPVLDSYVDASGARHDFTTGAESFKGLPLVFAFPKATAVESSGSATEYGHIVAPRAHVTMNLQYNGCVLAQSATMSGAAEGHMWPYNGTVLAVHTQDTFALQASKSLTGHALRAGEFRFAIWRANEQWEKEDADPRQPGTNPLKEVVNNGSGEVDFGSRTLGDADFGTCAPQPGGSCTQTKDFRYVIEEVRGGDPFITYDPSVYHITVPATHTTTYKAGTADGKHDTKVKVGAITYEKVSGGNTGNVSGAAFTNEYKDATLSLAKWMHGDVHGQTPQFDFEVTLYLPKGTDPQRIESIAGFAAPQGVDCVNGMEDCVVRRGTVNVAAGDSVSFAGLPLGTRYAITERAVDGYRLREFAGCVATVSGDGVTTCSGELGERSEQGGRQGAGANVTMVTATNEPLVPPEEHPETPVALPETGGPGRSRITLIGLGMVCVALPAMVVLVGRRSSESLSRNRFHSR